MTNDHSEETSPPEHTPPPSPPASPLSFRPGQYEFSAAQLQALTRITPGIEHAGPADLALFFHHCVITGLDPFTRQIYLIDRFDAEENRVVFTIQTGIQGFRTVAHRAAVHTGERISYGDAVYYDSGGRGREVWFASQPPKAVKVTVRRGESSYPAVAAWDEFAPMYWDARQNDYVLAPMWRRMPAHMLRKVAEAMALRMAAPIDLSGIYVDEEMAQADAEQVAGTARDAAARLRAAAGLENPDARDTSSDAEAADAASAPS